MGFVSSLVETPNPAGFGHFWLLLGTGPNPPGPTLEGDPTSTVFSRVSIYQVLAPSNFARMAKLHIHSSLGMGSRKFVLCQVGKAAGKSCWLASSPPRGRRVLNQLLRGGGGEYGTKHRIFFQGASRHAQNRVFELFFPRQIDK